MYVLQVDEQNSNLLGTNPLEKRSRAMLWRSGAISGLEQVDLFQVVPRYHVAHAR